MTRKARRSMGLTLALLMSCLLLALLVAGEVHYGSRWRTQQMAHLVHLPAADQPPGEEPVPVVDFSVAPIHHYAELVERPLFMSTRRPPPPEEEPLAEEAPPPSAPPQPPLQATLTSIVITPERRIALVRDHSSGQTVRLEHGSTLGGWLVELIQDDLVVLSRGEELQLLELRVYGKAKPPQKGPAGPLQARQRLQRPLPQ